MGEGIGRDGHHLDGLCCGLCCGLCFVRFTLMFPSGSRSTIRHRMEDVSHAHSHITMM